MGSAIPNQVDLGSMRKLAESEREPSMVSPLVSSKAPALTSLQDGL